MDDEAVSALEAAGYSVNSELSDGSFGAVYRATRRSDGLHVAAKAVRRDRLSREEEAAVHEQAHVLRGLRHKHLVSLVDAFEHETYLFHIFEFLHGADLYDRLEARGKPFSEPQALQLASQILRAVGYLHSRRAAHRDIKLENFVFETLPTARVPVLKLIDFDLMLVHPRDAPHGVTSTDMCGTVLYVPPELAAGRAYVPEEADMWAVGVVLYVLLCFEMPFQGRTPREILRSVRTCAPSFATAPWRRTSRKTRELVEALLSRSGAQRPSAEEALARVEAIAAGSVAPRIVSHSLRNMSHRLLIRSRGKGNPKRRRASLDDRDPREHPFLEQERASQDELDTLVCYEHPRLQPSFTTAGMAIYPRSSASRLALRGKIDIDANIDMGRLDSDHGSVETKGSVHRFLSRSSVRSEKGESRHGGLFKGRGGGKSRAHAKVMERPVDVGYC